MSRPMPKSAEEDMNVQDSFEEWWKAQNYDPESYRLEGIKLDMRFAWLAARKWQREQDAKLAEHKHLANGSCCGVGIAAAIRNQDAKP